ncbi:hypothetical protein MNBD_GAMMA24-739 [hydrothermal vent metagenome]|uniref:Uncharacterized protein n=1 Tax=hydrothermal vent metagenome TaxID=652676 RepID=A0A3B1BBN4_9ZZZZ
MRFKHAQALNYIQEETAQAKTTVAKPYSIISIYNYTLVVIVWRLCVNSALDDIYLAREQSKKHILHVQK